MSDQFVALLEEFVHNVLHNLFKPLLLFFYAGFLIPVLKVKFEFPKVLYQSITIYLLLAIGWHGGEELAKLSRTELAQAGGLMVIGFLTNLVIGFTAYGVLRSTTRLRQVDAATVAGYYGSDSAGTFATCVGVLLAEQIAYAAYMPVMLAIMEIPGCLVALLLIAKLRRSGMDAEGNMPGELGYRARRVGMAPARRHVAGEEDYEEETITVQEEQLAGTAAGSHTVARTTTTVRHTGGHGGVSEEDQARRKAEHLEDDLALQQHDSDADVPVQHVQSSSFLSKELLHEVFLNPGIYLLFGGILIGFVSRLQGEQVTAVDDPLFLTLFNGVLCLFLLEMGITASQKLRDLRTAGWRFVAFALLAPNVFATTGMLILHAYSLALGKPFDQGTYALFAVLCGAASYIALPAVQRMAIPEASPTLPLAASLGVTFSYNVTIGIPLYLMIAKIIITAIPLASTAAV